jgi:preprotein translocase subunit SecD
VNTLLMFGIMALIDGTFTLPGLAGVALSVAMAVDANVLIYERMREELELGSPLKAAIKTAYARALSAIVDGNITCLIVCIVLYKVGATEVKGFALTMSIGVVTTLFTGIWVTRAMFETALSAGLKRLPMLPTVVPAISRLLLLKVDWIAIRPVLFGSSGVLAVLALVALFARGNDIFETEFRGGVSMTLSTRMASQGEPQTDNRRLALSRVEVEKQVRAVGAAAGDNTIVAPMCSRLVSRTRMVLRQASLSELAIRRRWLTTMNHASAAKCRPPSSSRLPRTSMCAFRWSLQIRPAATTRCRPSRLRRRS